MSYSAVVLCLCVCAAVVVVVSYPTEYDVHMFTAGVKYDHSIPMSGGSDRIRHPGNFDPLYISVATSAKSDYVIDYIEVDATVDVGADVSFCVIQGSPGSRTLVFRLAANGSDFLSYTYRSYGLWASEYSKVVAASVRPDAC